jgi:hypothetical protein
LNDINDVYGHIHHHQISKICVIDDAWGMIPKSNSWDDVRCGREGSSKGIAGHILGFMIYRVYTCLYINDAKF